MWSIIPLLLMCRTSVDRINSSCTIPYFYFKLIPGLKHLIELSEFQTYSEKVFMIHINYVLQTSLEEGQNWEAEGQTQLQRDIFKVASRRKRGWQL